MYYNHNIVILPFHCERKGSDNDKSNNNNSIMKRRVVAIMKNKGNKNQKKNNKNDNNPGSRKAWKKLLWGAKLRVLY